MADEINRYEQIQDVLKAIYGELMLEDVKFMQRPGFPMSDETTWKRDAEACRVAMCSPGLISGLAKHLFGEIEE